MIWNYVKDYEKPSLKFEGFYRGIVESRDDPDNDGRCQIRVYPMFENVESAQLPWATPSDIFRDGGFFVPKPGTKVWCFFENGDWRYPVYFAGAPAHGDKPSEATNVYKKIYKSESGVLIEIDDTPGAVQLMITMPSGYSNVIDNSGNKTETIPGNNNVTISGNFTLNVTGNVQVIASGTASVMAGGTVSIQGSVVEIN